MGVLGNGPTTHPSTRLIFVEPTLPVCTRRSRMSPTPPPTRLIACGRPRASSVKLPSLQLTRGSVRLILPLLFLSSLASALLLRHCPTLVMEATMSMAVVDLCCRAPVVVCGMLLPEALQGGSDGNGDASDVKAELLLATRQKHSNISRPTSKRA